MKTKEELRKYQAEYMRKRRGQSDHIKTTEEKMGVMNLDGELWLPVTGFEAAYEVSNYGRVKSLPKEKYYFGYKKIRPEKILTLNSLNTSGYRHVSLRRIDGTRKMGIIHRMVAEAFIPNPKNKKEVNHIDTDKLNNNVSNLEWLNRNEHVLHTNKFIKFNRVKGVEHWKSKVDINTVKKIKKLYSSGECTSYAELGRRFNLERHHAGRIIKGINWKEVTI